MKRAVLSVAVVALCVAGSAVAQDRSGGLIGSGTRSDGQMMGSGNALDVFMGSGGYLGNGGRTEESGQVVGQMMGSGGFVTSLSGQYLGSGGRTESDGQATASDGQVMGSGGLIGSGTRAEDSSPLIGSGAGVTSQEGGFLGSGNLVIELERWDGWSVLVVSSHAGIFVIPIEE